MIGVRQAMVLAAGLGTRMRPLTEETAKPLLPLGGRPLLGHILDQLAASGVERAVVNAHWQAERVAAFLAARPGAPETILYREPGLTDTGGAVRDALAEGLLRPEPFYVINGDVFWLDGPAPALRRLAAEFDQAALDGVMLAHRTFQVHGETGPGDFALDKWGAPRRRAEREVVPYIYAGLQLLAPEALRGTPAGPFSMNLVWDRAIEAGRLRAVVHDGLWFHLTTPQDLAEAEFNLQARFPDARQ